MSLISLVIALAIFGFILWLFNTYVTAIDPKVKNLINIVVIVVLIIWVFQVLGVFAHVPDIRVGD